jgi:hypothetical protein
MAQKDDLEAVRAVVAALDGFDPEEQERIIRWAREKVKLPVSGLAASAANPTIQQPAIVPAVAPVATGPAAARDLRTFVAEKKPKSDVQFAATIAYFYRFEAPEAERKVEIVAEDLAEACRLANRERLRSPLQTLANARTLGLLDSPRRGAFAINAVGENLVAMTLPGDGNATSSAPKRKAEKKAGRKAMQKRAGKK